MTIKSRLNVSRIMLFCLAVVLVISVIYPVLSVMAQEKAVVYTKPWLESFDFFKALVGGLFVLVGWFFIRTISKVDKNQTLLFDKLAAVCKQVDMLQGEHNARKEMCGK